MTPRIELVITDVDNTLFDGVRCWARAVRPMIGRLAARAGWAESEAEREIARVHARWGATECPACVVALVDGEGADRARNEIIHSYEADFVAARPLYAGTVDALGALGRAGARIVAYTESPAPFTARRLSLLGLDRFIDALYGREEIEGWRPHATWTDAPAAIAVGRHELKPDPAVVRRIVVRAGAEPGGTLYIGDNLWKDVQMANRAGVRSAWARYGTRRTDEDESLLRRLCHWTPEDTAAERCVAGVRPDAILDRLPDVFAHFSFGPR